MVKLRNILRKPISKESSGDDVQVEAPRHPRGGVYNNQFVHQKIADHAFINSKEFRTQDISEVLRNSNRVRDWSRWYSRSTKGST
jgi:hypothetical protein